MENDIGQWFGTWDKSVHIALTGVYFFVLIIGMVRVLGKRVTSQFNNFDWIINVAVGSLAASGILLESVAVSDATVAIIVLAGCQWLVTWAVMRFSIVEDIVKASPRVLTHKGELLGEAMRRERVSEAEVRAKLREKGYANLDDANWVILETDGSLTVIPQQSAALPEVELMSDVEHPESLR